MSEQEPENKNLINFIAATVESMRDQMVWTRGEMFEMRKEMAEMRDQLATKRDLEGMATKSDLEGMATKSDLAQLEGRLTTKLEVEITIVRGDIEQVHMRLDSIERAIRVRLDRVEAEVSRLRSVVYLLVKDRPDMLRLLGETPPASDEGRP
ncbi:MAG TPA: hypothetical protein VJ715_03540 [Pyrinomonadaceae bacterium]|nr:hypothetical protein [Pyrinomonadaceae bacterium]